MKLSEFRKLIREEISKVMTEDFEDLKAVHSQVMDKHEKSNQMLQAFKSKKTIEPKYYKAVTRDKDEFVQLAAKQLGLKPTPDRLGAVSKDGSWAVSAVRDTAPFSREVYIKVFAKDRSTLEQAFDLLLTVRK